MKRQRLLPSAGLILSMVIVLGAPMGAVDRVYFTWSNDLGDIWVTNVTPAAGP